MEKEKEMKKTGQDLLNTAQKYIGRPYVLGAVVPKSRLDYDGPFDCAELCARVIYEETETLYGCRPDDQAKATTSDAYTGYFGIDAEKLGTKITVEDAARIPGALLLRLPTGSAIGHIAFSKGDGKTIEARGSKYGVVEHKVSGRDWDYGILLPFIDYSKNPVVKVQKPIGKLIKLVTPFLIDAAVGLIQKVLKDKGFYTGSIDKVYGPKTQAAVVKFQKLNGLTPDGQIKSGGETVQALGITI